MTDMPPGDVDHVGQELHCENAMYLRFEKEEEEGGGGIVERSECALGAGREEGSLAGGAGSAFLPC
jgi:hypothetical protein